ncbi:MAG: glutamate-5-semialdehyde dehydrogenase [Candidatus Nanopelagicales bacterium]
MTDTFSTVAARSREAAVVLRALTTADKDRGLASIATHLDKDRATIVAANAEDVAAARAAGTPAGLLDRLTLSDDRLTAIIDAIGTVIELPDPVGQVVRGYSLPNGLAVSQVRVPMGVVGMIYEARPNVTVDAAALCLKSGNAVLLRGSSSAARTNAALIATMRGALASEDLPADAIQAVPGSGHGTVDDLITARGLVDVVIPRGGADLIDRVVDGATVPVIETGVGNCHVYVDRAADPAKAEAIVVNAKTQRPSVCNAAETLLVHRDLADTLLVRLGRALTEAGVTLHADPDAATALRQGGVDSVPVTDADWAAEYYSLDLAVGVVDDTAAAAAHIRRWSSGHTEAIVSDSASTIQEFVAGVDSAAIAINASTRFTDGGELGFGAEIGISTQKLHARGPMALPELTTTTFLITGDGQIRS